MTTTEMINAFTVGYDIANLEGPGYEDNEILIFLNKSQIIEVLKEVSIKRWSYISNLIENETGNTNPVAHEFSHSLFYTPSHDYLAYISSKSYVVRSDYKEVNYEWIGNRLISKDVSHKYVTNALNKPILLEPCVYEDEDGTIAIIHDQETTYQNQNDFYLEYIRYPVQITSVVDCELNEIPMHERIVNTAINFAKGVFNANEQAILAQADRIIKQPEL